MIFINIFLKRNHEGWGMWKNLRNLQTYIIHVIIDLRRGHGLLSTNTEILSHPTWDICLFLTFIVPVLASFNLQTQSRKIGEHLMVLLATHSSFFCQFNAGSMVVKIINQFAFKINTSKLLFNVCINVDGIDFDRSWFPANEIF